MNSLAIFEQGSIVILISFLILVILACALAIVITESSVQGEHLPDFVRTKSFKICTGIYLCSVFIFICLGFMALLVKGVNLIHH